jgi:hypothetical protein
LTQCYVATVAALNSCGIYPDGAEIKPYLVEDLSLVTPEVTKFEVDMILVGMVKEGVKFTGGRASQKAFDEHPMFTGNTMSPVGTEAE